MIHLVGNFSAFLSVFLYLIVHRFVGLLFFLLKTDLRPRLNWMIRS
jgi:hypothetical protein